jgi:hypothetical protein
VIFENQNKIKNFHELIEKYAGSKEYLLSIGWLNKNSNISEV